MLSPRFPPKGQGEGEGVQLGGGGGAQGMVVRGDWGRRYEERVGKDRDSLTAQTPASLPCSPTALETRQELHFIWQLRQ